MLLIALLSLLLASALTARGPEREGSLSFSPADLAITREGGYDRIEVAGWATDATPGEPLLPVLGITVSLPVGQTVRRVVVDSFERQELAGPVRPMPGVSRGADGKPSRQNGPAYSAGDERPQVILELTSQGFAGGEPVASLVFRGVHWNPRTGALVLYPRVRYHLELEAAGAAAPAPVRPRRALHAGARSPVALDGEGKTFAPVPPAGDLDAAGGAAEGEFILLHPGQYPALDNSLVEFLIITDDALASQFQRLADWRTRTGTPAAVRTISQIEAGYPQGVDLAEKIRLFIRDAYTFWGTRWVLLGADHELLPARFVFLDYYFANGANVSTDLYFSTLDGNWNHDGDSIYGEPYISGYNQGDWVDMYPEVYVGRAPVATPSEAGAFVDKVLAYQKNAISSYVRKALFCAEVVFPVGWQPGQPIQLNGCELAHAAGAFLPAGWDTLYLCQWPNQNENLTSVVNALNQGYHLVTVVGHGDPFKWSTSDGKFFMIDNALAMTNNNRFSVFFYANCNTNQGEMECLNEYMLLHPTGGSIGAVATTDYDFPDAGRYHHEEFYRLYAENSTLTLGELQADMKIPFIPLSQSDNAHRWTQFVYNLLGDPALPVWRTPPASLQVTDAGVMAVGDTTYAVMVRKAIGGLPVADARVTLWKMETGEYARGRTDAAGMATLPFRPASPGTVMLSVFHPSYYPSLDSLQVTGGQPLVYLSGIAVDDTSLGNGNGLLEAGEQAELEITLTNGGAGSSDFFAGTLSLLAGSRLLMDVTVDATHAPGLLMLGKDRVHPASLPCTLGLGAPAMVLGRPPYTAEALGDTAADPQDSSAVDLAARAYLWEDMSGWHLRAAGALESHSFHGSVWGDSRFRSLEPYRLELSDVLTQVGDSLAFSFAVGPTEAEDGFDLVLADSSFVHVLVDTATYGWLPAGGSATRSFLVEAMPRAPDAHRTRLDLHLTGATTNRDEAVVLDLHAPSLEQVTHAVNDSAGGDGDRVAEPGETVRLLVTLLNQGSGEAQGVSGILRAVSGGVVVDSLAVVGDVAPGAEATISPGFSVAVSDSLVSLGLSLATSRGESWTIPLDIGILSRPPTPTGLTGLAGSDWMSLHWSPATHPDLRGYNLYVGGGTGTLVNDRVIDATCYYRAEGLSPETNYLFRVAAVDSAGNQSLLSTALPAKTGAPYQAGWPALARNRVWSCPAIADVDFDGTQEVVVGSKDWRVFIWRSDASDLTGWPKVVGNVVDASPAVGDVNGDRSMEIFAGCDDGKLYAWRGNGTGLLVPSGVFANVGSLIRSAPTLADLDGDTVPEVLVGDDGGKLHAWRADGTGYLQPDGIFATVSGALISSPSVADVDGDTHPEIFINSFLGGVYAWNHDGTPVRLAGGLFRWIGNGKIYSTPALGDVDANGSVEIVVSGGADSVYVFHSSGTVLTGWPKKVGKPCWSSPALGDLDNDGKLEVVVGSNDAKVYAWRYTGAAVGGWPATLPDSVISSPAIGDITGDDYPEVVVGCCDSKIYALRNTGIIVPGWPRATYDRIYSSPALGDLDGDGDVEVVCGSYDGFVYAYDLAARYSASTMDWPMYCHDRHRSGFAGWQDPIRTSVAEGGTGTPPVLATELAMPWPNPARGGARVSFQLRTGGKTTLELFDVTGRKVRTLAAGEQEAGRHDLQWDGRDARGRTVSPGVYFVRLAAGERTLVRKLVVAP